MADSSDQRRRRPIDVPQGQCYDNAVMENFFGHLKEELFHHVRFLSTDALAAQQKEYIRWYNTERISTKLEGLSPVQYRAQTLAAQGLASHSNFGDQFKPRPGPLHPALDRRALHISCARPSWSNRSESSSPSAGSREPGSG
ncbi:IS3 family transposase [Arthrobacter sp. UYCu723]